eukprot:2370461-Heterocapsa_arctica.AAC.1
MVYPSGNDGGGSWVVATAVATPSYHISSIIILLAPRMAHWPELINTKAMPGWSRVCRPPRKTSPTSDCWNIRSRTASETMLPGRPKSYLGAGYKKPPAKAPTRSVKVGK